QRRQMELIGERMTHFVKADEEHVADDEVGLVARVLPGSFDRRLVIGSRALMLGHGNGAGDCAEDDCQSGEGLREHSERSRVVARTMSRMTTAMNQPDGCRVSVPANAILVKNAYLALVSVMSDRFDETDS